MSRTRAVLAIALALATLAASQPARAQSTPGLFPERYAACRDREATAARATPSAPPAFAPLRRMAAPPPMPIAPLTSIDVAIAEPIPTRPSDAPSAAPPALVASAGQDWRCVGFARGKAGILRVLRAPPLTRFAGHADPRAWILLNARAASTAGFTEALPALRRLLAREVVETPDDAPRPDGSRLFDALDLDLNVARALGDLFDASSAQTFREHLLAREDRSYSLLWLGGLPALDRLDHGIAEAYASDVVARVAAGRRPTDPLAASDDTILRAALPMLRTPDPERLAVVRRLPDPDRRCDILAARLRLGDVALRDALRPELATDLTTQRGVACYDALMPDLFPGRDPSEVPTLLHRHRMEAILDLLRRSIDHPMTDPTWARAREQLRTALAARAGDPDVAGGASDRRYSPRKRAQHLVALAELGDGAARAAVARTIRDPADHGVAPWIAAAQALRFGWSEAADLAAARLALAIRSLTDRYDTELAPVRGFANRDEHTDVVDALAARRDPRFALGLLDRDRNVREVTAWHLARLRLPEACEVVAGAAPAAEEIAVQDAFWALTLLDDACREPAHRLATDRAAPPHVRGMALELLAMMRDPRARPLLASPGRRDDIRAARARARIIFDARD